MSKNTKITSVLCAPQLRGMWNDVEWKKLMIDVSDIYSVMGYGGVSPDSQTMAVVDELLPQALSVADPSFAYRVVDAAVVNRLDILLDGVEFRVGGIINSYLEGMTRACVFVATAGLEYDSWLKSVKAQGDILYEYVADSIGSVIAESCVDRLAEEIRSKYKGGCSLPYSPGYCAWNVSDQKKLFSILPQDRCGVTLTESCLMHPVKSVSGFFAMGEHLVHQPYRCELCTNKNCYKNRKK